MSTLTSGNYVGDVRERRARSGSSSSSSSSLPRYGHSPARPGPARLGRVPITSGSTLACWLRRPSLPRTGVAATGHACPSVRPSVRRTLHPAHTLVVRATRQCRVVAAESSIFASVGDVMTVLPVSCLLRRVARVHTRNVCGQCSVRICFYFGKTTELEQRRATS